MYKLLNGLLCLFGHRVEGGELYLVVSGTKEVEVKLDFTPREVWANFRGPHCVPVCQGGTDCFDIRIVPNGFVLHVNLTSDSREVEWLAIK